MWRGPTTVTTTNIETETVYIDLQQNPSRENIALNVLFLEQLWHLYIPEAEKDIIERLWLPSFPILYHPPLSLDTFLEGFHEGAMLQLVVGEMKRKNPKSYISIDGYYHHDDPITTERMLRFRCAEEVGEALIGELFRSVYEMSAGDMWNEQQELWQKTHQHVHS